MGDKNDPEMHVKKNNDTTNNLGNNQENNPRQDSKDEPDPRTFLYSSSVYKKVEVETVQSPTSRDALYYNMNHPKRGIAVILNHEHFTVPKLRSRSGTHADKKSLDTLFNELGFEVRSYTDLVFENVRKVVEEAAAYDHSKCDCFVLAVLSHGEQGILYAKDYPYDPQLLWAPFTGDKCKSLAGKPKIFFVQACQGDSLDGGISMVSRTEVDSSIHYRIPIHADFLIAFSTVPGYFSWRNTTKGSWFIQALCEVLAAHAYEWDLMTILTLIMQKVAIHSESNVPDNPKMHNQKQMPYITTTLTRLVAFKRK